MTNQSERAWFPAFSRMLAAAAGRQWAFTAAVGLVLLWAIAGPMFDYSENWQLVINTCTTIVTFLMVFLIQATQNRDTEAMQLKLDEIIRATQGAHNELLDMERASDEELEALHKRYSELAEQARGRLKRGDTDVDSPPLDESKA